MTFIRAGHPIRPTRQNISLDLYLHLRRPHRPSRGSTPLRARRTSRSWRAATRCRLERGIRNCYRHHLPELPSRVGPARNLPTSKVRYVIIIIIFNVPDSDGRHVMHGLSFLLKLLKWFIKLGSDILRLVLTSCKSAASSNCRSLLQ